MNFSCAEYGINVDEQNMMTIKDGTIYCPECFEELFDENSLEVYSD